MARPREFDEQQVLRTVRETFWENGYAGTSMDAIAAATGLGKGSLYGAFGGKSPLFMTVFDSYCTDISQGSERALDGPDAGALDRVAAYVRSVAEGTAADTANRGCLLAKGTAERSEHDPAVAERGRQALRRVEAALAAALAAAQRHGDLAADADPKALAGMLLALTRGIEAVGRSGIGGAALRGMAEQAIALLPRP
jgi:AcrR family transcriptional regulator